MHLYTGLKRVRLTATQPGRKGRAQATEAQGTAVQRAKNRAEEGSAACQFSRLTTHAHSEVTVDCSRSGPQQGAAEGRRKRGREERHGYGCRPCVRRCRLWDGAVNQVPLEAMPLLPSACACSIVPPPCFVLFSPQGDASIAHPPVLALLCPVRHVCSAVRRACLLVRGCPMSGGLTCTGHRLGGERKDSRTNGPAAQDARHGGTDSERQQEGEGRHERKGAQSMGVTEARCAPAPAGSGGGGQRRRGGWAGSRDGKPQTGNNMPDYEPRRGMNRTRACQCS
jgi:hypothetical protein